MTSSTEEAGRPLILACCRPSGRVHGASMAKRGKRKTRKKNDSYAGLYWTALLIVGLMAWSQRSLGLGLLAIGLWCWYALFARKTTCGVLNTDGTFCSEDAIGSLGTCHRTKHRRSKRAVLWDTVLPWLPNPFARQPMWIPTRSQARYSTSGYVPVTELRSRNRRERINLWLSFVATVATVIGTWLTAQGH